MMKTIRKRLINIQFSILHLFMPNSIKQILKCEITLQEVLNASIMWPNCTASNISIGLPQYRLNASVFSVKRS